jgi:hypothetical protein
MDFVFHDGGRAAAGYKGMTGDCVTRSIAIATGKTYQEVYDAPQPASTSGAHGQTQDETVKQPDWRVSPDLSTLS